MSSDLSSVFAGEQKAKRSTFLTILCVLTLIGNTFGIVSNITSFMQAEKTASKIIDSKTKVQEDINSKDTLSNGSKNPGAEFAKKIAGSLSAFTDVGKTRQNAIFSIVGCALAIFGAVLMLMLKRIGFFTFIAGKLVAIITPLAIYGVGNIAITLGVAFAGFFALLFIVLYALNVKDLK